MGGTPRFGVEEEFLVIDRVSRAVVPRAAEVLAAASPRLGARVSGEITKLQVESRTEPCATLAELTGQLVEGRRVLVEAAAGLGLGVIASGTPILGAPVPPPMTEGPRQDRGTATFRGLHDELAICALHVHVELPDRDRAVLVGNHLRPWLPVLLALSANSPFWAERDTGYASWRTLTWPRWPVAGPPPYLRSAAAYDALVDTLLAAGALVDRGTIFWDVRPSAHLPTLEIRVADVPVTAAESAHLAAIVRALVVTSAAAVDRGDPGPEIPAESLRVAYWRAARDGLAGSGFDVHSGQLRDLGDLVDGLSATIRPALAESGELADVTGWLADLRASGDGATRQRRSAARDGLAGVVDYLASAVASDVRVATV